LRERYWRKLCRKEDLVGICIPNSAEVPRIGERTFQGVIVRGKHFRKFVQSGGEDINAAAIDFIKFFFSAYEMERSSLLGPGFWQRECAGIEVKRRECAPAVGRDAALAPVQPTRDHEMENQPEGRSVCISRGIHLKADCNALSDAAQRNHFAIL